ncbi:MAG: hypothetical protein ACTTKP_08765 [Catonella sp.]
MDKKKQMIEYMIQNCIISYQIPKQNFTGKALPTYMDCFKMNLTSDV